MPDEALVPVPPGNLGAVATADLRAELARSLEVTARHLTRLAAVWRELEHRGEDLSHLRSGLWSYMPLIASGRLRAEIVVQYAGHSMLLRRLAELRLEDQEALLRDNTVLVVDHVDGEWRERRVPLTRLRVDEMTQVVGDRIRSPEDQRRAALARSRRRKPGPRSRPSSLDAATAAIPSRQLGSVAVGLSLRLSRAQSDALDREAAARGVSAAKLVIASLIVAGVIPGQEV